MNSQHDSPKSEPIDPVREAEILLEVAEALDLMANQAKERARAALARIGRPLPLFPNLDDAEEGR